jgi:hypothetical protein
MPFLMRAAFSRVIPGSNPKSGSQSPHAAPPSNTSARVKFSSGNVADLTDLKEDFRFVVEGFDKHRDLFVRVVDISKSQ